MALQRPAEAWQKAQLLADAGPFDYYRLTPAQHSLLETAWQALYPTTPYPCSTRSCPGRIRAAHKQLLEELKYHLAQPPTPVENLNNKTAAEAAAAAAAAAPTTTATTGSRYRFADGVTEIREFGNPIPHAKATDKLYQRLVSQCEDYARLFVDTEAEAAEAAVNTAVQEEEEAPLGGSLNDKDKGPKLPSASAVKAMNRDEVTSQYRQELQADEVPAELDTNGKIAAAILAHREAQAAA